MIYTDMTKLAIKLSFEAHKNQVDKAGLPYPFHPFHVAEQMDNENSTIVALLHDIVEDTKYTINDLEEMGFSREILDAISLMTHDENIPYMNYVLRIKENPLARKVKIADLAHNSDLSRLDSVTKNDILRAIKYNIAKALLCEDEYDESMGYYVKRVPLDLKNLFFISLRYIDNVILSASIDEEAACDSHYSFSGDKYQILLEKFTTLELSNFEMLSKILIEKGKNALINEVSEVICGFDEIYHFDSY